MTKLGSPLIDRDGYAERVSTRMGGAAHRRLRYGVLSHLWLRGMALRAGGVGWAPRPTAAPPVRGSVPSRLPRFPGRPSCVSSVHSCPLHSLYVHPPHHYRLRKRHSAYQTTRTARPRARCLRRREESCPKCQDTRIIGRRKDRKRERKNIMTAMKLKNVNDLNRPRTVSFARSTRVTQHNIVLHRHVTSVRCPADWMALACRDRRSGEPLRTAHLVLPCERRHGG